MARTPAPALLATATLAAMSTNFQWANAADPKAIDAGKPPRDLADTYKSLDLAGHPGAVCVLVPPKVEIDAETALQILSGSTMNGRYIDYDAAKKLLADDRKAKSPGTFKARYGTGKKLDSVAVLTHELGLLRRAHHSEPRRIAGSPDIRGEHVAVH